MVINYITTAYHMIVNGSRLTAILGVLAWLQQFSLFKSVFLFAKYSFSKIILFIFGILQLFFTTTHFGNILERTRARRNYAKPKKLIKTVYFIRHGESIWNSMFSNGVTGFLTIPIILFQELCLFLTPHTLLFDSPLSKLGRKQALNLGLDVEEVVHSNAPDANTSERLRLLTEFRHRLSEPGHCVIACSPLRRAISTLLYGIKDIKLQPPIVILKCLQETTRNIDGIPLASSKSSPPVLHKDEADLAKAYGNLDLRQYTGRHGFWGTHQHVADRLFDFAEWVFDSGHEETETFIVGGHCLWFRNFFRAFAVKDTPAKLFKIPNGKIVKFTFVASHEGGYSAENILPVNFESW